MNHEAGSKEYAKEPLPLMALVLISLVVGLVGGYGGSYLQSRSAERVGAFQKPSDPAAPAPVLKGSEEEAVIAVVKKVSPSVVSIIVSKDISKMLNRTGPDIAPFDNFFEFGFPFDFKFTPNQQKGIGKNDVPKGKQRIGGVTGDTLGANVEIVEVAVFLTAVATIR